MRLIKVSVLLILFALVSVSCGSKSDTNAEKREKPAVSVDILIAANTDFYSDVEVNGTVLSEEMISLYPEVSGRLIYLNIPDGATVQAGTVLARINDADLQAQLLQQKVQLELAEKTEERLRQLLAVNGVDQASYDAALSQVNLYNANISVLKAQIDKTVIRAPFAGSLGLRLVSEGAYVSPSTLIGTLQKTDRVKIDFSVPDAYENMVRPGRIVEIAAGTAIDKLTATVSAIEPQISTATRNIKVRARLNKGILSPGAFVKVLLHEKVSGIVVPTNAIIPDAMSNQVVLVKDGKAVFQNVETGIRNKDVVEIKTGIEAGDTVVVNGVLFVRPNGNVRINKVRK